jgi:RNA polymerase sigma-70 factor (ECF subfamily)
LGTFHQDIEAAIPALRRYGRALTRDAETADDLVQDTLVRALRSEHLFLGGDVRGRSRCWSTSSAPRCCWWCSKD